jgi:multidrug efflux system membrane fusion protein
MHGELPKHHAKAKRTGRFRAALVWMIVLAAVAAALWYVFFAMGSPEHRPFGRRFGGGGGAQAVPVLAAVAATADVPVTLSAVGTTQAINTVTVKPQVDGKLIAVEFKEGQDVKKGDVLARIDPTMFRAALDQATAKKAQDEAQLANARNDLERYAKLAASNAINKQQADTQRALVAQYTAQVQADSAAIESAQATLSYTDVRAPIDGRTGIRQVDAGNIVRASDATGLVVITQLKPIGVVFTIPQQDVQRVNAAFARNPLAADALRPDSNHAIEHGTLTVVDNQVDPATGTVKLKAEFPNAQMQLWPGQFVNVRLTVDTLKNATVIPTSAVQRGPNGTFVYVIDGESKAHMRPISVRRQDETQTVVSSGVTPGDRVVTTGFVQLTDGKAVHVGSDTPAPPAAAQGERPRGQRGNGQRGAPGQRQGNGRPRPAAAQ